MNEKCILLPFETPRDGMVWTRGIYDMFVRDFTRPITPDDVRGMIRGWDEWTEDERAEYCALVDQCALYSNGVARALDIALRPAPEPDPWEEMDRIIIDGGTDVELLDAWDRLKATRGDK